MSCDKVSYKSRRAAHRASRRVTTSSGKQFREYLCEECHKWHLTSNHKSLRDTPAAPSERQRRARKVRTLGELEALAEKMRVKS